MLFPEPAFLFGFLPVLLLLYQPAPRGLRNALLTAFSLGFYAVGEKLYAGIMLASIAVNYAIAPAGRGGRSARAAAVLGGRSGWRRTWGCSGSSSTPTSWSAT